MNTDYQGTMLQDFYKIVSNLQPKLEKYERTEEIVERVAGVIEKSGFLVKYDHHIAPLIDDAVLRNQYDENDLPKFRRELDEIGQDDYVILCNYDSLPVSLKDLLDKKGKPVELLTYDECVHRAEDGLNVLLRFSSFNRYGYYLYFGAAWAIVKAEHPDWNYETFIECFRRDVVDLMAERSKYYLGYKEFTTNG